MPKSTTKKTPVRKKMALGRGIDALLPDIELSPEKRLAAGYQKCQIDRIRPNRYQPRRHFAPDELSELSASIKKQGLLQPLLVRRDADGFELVTGERRLRAAKMAGLDQIYIIVKDVTDRDMLEMSIVENVQREDLNPVEEAEAYHRLMTEFKLTQEEVAARVGKSRPAVANFLRIRQLSGDIKDSLSKGQISMGHARALLAAPNAAARRHIFGLIIKKQLSVRQIEEMIKRLQEAEAGRPVGKISAEQRYYQDMAEDLSRNVGTRVNISRRGKKGRIMIEFYGDEDLNRLIRLLKGK